jgi:4'-phosphopantetheinyl transferase
MSTLLPPAAGRTWQASAEGNELELAPDEIHVWCAELDEQSSNTDAFNAVLSQDELRRAARFCCERDRQRFVMRRGVLRILLGDYLRIGPDQLEFKYGRQGKPALFLPAVDRLQFNLSHSDGLALYAMSWDCALGIDVERVRPINEARQIVAQFFSPAEKARWHSLPSDQRTDFFLKTWTRMEACLKASGGGLTELSNRSASALRGPDRQVRGPEYGNDNKSWQICELTPAPGYVASLAWNRPSSLLGWAASPPAYRR